MTRHYHFYTLSEIHDLAVHYGDQIRDEDVRLDTRLALSGFLTWLGNREREGGEGNVLEFDLRKESDERVATD